MVKNLPLPSAKPLFPADFQTFDLETLRPISSLPSAKTSASSAPPRFASSKLKPLSSSAPLRDLRASAVNSSSIRPATIIIPLNDP